MSAELLPSPKRPRVMLAGNDNGTKTTTTSSASTRSRAIFIDEDAHLALQDDEWQPPMTASTTRPTNVRPSLAAVASTTSAASANGVQKVPNAAPPSSTSATMLSGDEKNLHTAQFGVRSVSDNQTTSTRAPTTDDASRSTRAPISSVDSRCDTASNTVDASPINENGEFTLYIIKAIDTSDKLTERLMTGEKITATVSRPVLYSCDDDDDDDNLFCGSI
jgi:hypothetical protein